MTKKMKLYLTVSAALCILAVGILIFAELSRDWFYNRELKKVKACVERSEYEKAEAEYRKMIEKYPEKQELYIELSSLYDQNNAFEMALETLFTAQMKSDGVTADTNLAKQEEIIREHMFYAEMEDNGFSKEMADRYMQMIKDGVDLSDMEDEEILELLKNREIPEEE